MRIGCLQFAPQVGDIDNNLNRADAVLSRANPEDLDILVLPELAFTGYNFKSLQDISPFLEPSKSGITSLWARTTALKYNCVVAVGYPEKVDVSNNWPTSPEYYNSLIVVNEEGETIANYRKTHLYYTDETWALENPKGFYQGWIAGLGPTAMGICMDLNPYRFETPWSAFEFAFHVLDANANVVILSMAWLTREDARDFSQMPKDPDMDTLTYWVKRLEPLIRAEGDDEIIVIFANRTGVEGDAVYAGTSAVIGIKNGEVNVYGLLGRGEKELLVVDTDTPPFGQLVYRPEQHTAVGNDTSPHSAISPTQRAAGIPLPESNTSSTVTYPTSPTNNSRTEGMGSVKSSKGMPDIDGVDALHVFEDHMFMTQDPAMPLTGSTSTPATHFEESPVSARHFWALADHLKPPRIPRSPTSSTRSNHADSPIEPNVPLGRGRKVGDASHPFERSNIAAPQLPKLSEQVDTLRDGKSPQVSPRTTSTGRTRSSKSRHRSRTRRRERSDSNAVALPVAYSEPQQAHPEHQRSTSPDLEKLGADMLVFEEGTHPKRDSLVCHPDEDDFVVFHSSRREQVKSPKKEQTSSNKVHKHARNKSVDIDNRGSEPPPRRSHTPRLDSPRNGEPQSRPSKTSSRTKGSPQIPASRTFGRGEQRDSRQSSQRDSPNLPQRPFPRLTSPRSKYNRSGSNQTSPISPHTDPMPVAEKVQAWNDQSSSRYGGQNDLERNRNASRSSNSADKPRALPEEKANNNYTSSTVTIGMHNSPRAPRDGLKTPKAMILVPELDETEVVPTMTKTTAVETVPFKCVVSVDARRSERPRSVVW